jgi:preprotein translocase subunit SecG
MDTLMIVFGIILLALSALMIGLVMAQPGKDKKLSGAIAGGSDTYYGKGKSNRADKVLSRITVAVAVVFVVIVIAMYCIV